MPAAKALKYKPDYSDTRLQAVQRLTGLNDARSTRKAIDVLRAGAWFERLRSALHVNTAYAVGKRIQPQTYQARADGRWPQHHNLWAKYAQGRHLPGPDTVRAAEATVPGSSRVLDAVLWKVLDLHHPIRSDGDAWLRQLRPDVQTAVFDPVPLRAGRYVRRAGAARSLHMLEAQADLDGVAAMAILLREAHEAGNHARAFQIGRSLHGALLMLTCTSSLFWSAPELFEYFGRTIFPLASDKDVAFDVQQTELREQQILLNRIIMQLEDTGKIGISRGITWYHRQIFAGRYGFDLQFGLGPRWKLARPPVQCSKSACRFVASTGVVRTWGLTVLRDGRRERLMPEEVIKQMAQAGRMAQQEPSDDEIPET